MPQVDLEQLAGLVGKLTESVRVLGDEDRIRRIAAAVMAHPGRQQKRGYSPDDIDETAAADRLSRLGRELQQAQGSKRLELLQTTPVPVAADALRVQEDSVRRFHQAADRLLIGATILRQSALDPHAFDPRELDFFKTVYQPALQAADTGTTAEGKEFVPTRLSATLAERISLELMVADLFVSVDMPTNPYEIPAFGVSRLRLGKAVEQTADTGQTGFKKVTPPTRKITFNAAKFAGETIVSRELEEDAVFAAIPMYEDELIDYLGGDLEDAIVNGDTSGTHQDSDVTASDDPRKNWTGLRKHALTAAKTDAANAALTVAMLRANRKKMGKYGIGSDRLAHIVSMAGFMALLADSNVMTLDKYGPKATVLTGELAKVDGAPIIVSEYVRQDLNATGVFDNVTTNRTLAVTVNRRGFALGNRRDMSVQVLREVYAEYDQDAILVTMRKAFTPRFAATTEPIVALHYNVQT